jgi:hypothetical protein
LSTVNHILALLLARVVEEGASCGNSRGKSEAARNKPTANANEQRNESKLSMPLDYDEDAGYFVDALQTLNDAWKPSYLQFGVLEIGEYNTRLAKAPPLRAPGLVSRRKGYFVWKGSVKTLMASGQILLHEKNYIETISDRYAQFVVDTGRTSVRGHSYSFCKVFAREFHVKNAHELLTEEKAWIPSREMVTKLRAEYVASLKPEPEQSPGGPPTSSIDFLPNGSSPDAPTKTLGLIPETPVQPVTKPNPEMSQFQREQIELQKERMKMEKENSSRSLQIQETLAAAVTSSTTTASNSTKAVENSTKTVVHMTKAVEHSTLTNLEQAKTINNLTAPEQTTPKKKKASSTSRSASKAATPGGGIQVRHTKTGKIGLKKKNGWITFADGSTSVRGPSEDWEPL